MNWLSRQINKIGKRLIDKIDADAEAKKADLMKKANVELKKQAADILEKSKNIKAKENLTQAEIDQIAADLYKLLK